MHFNWRWFYFLFGEISNHRNNCYQNNEVKYHFRPHAQLLEYNQSSQILHNSESNDQTLQKYAPQITCIEHKNGKLWSSNCNTFLGINILLNTKIFQTFHLLPEPRQRFPLHSNIAFYSRKIQLCKLNVAISYTKWNTISSFLP